MSSETPKGAIKTGDVVIMNDFDCPSAAMCAVVTDVHPDGSCHGVYLTTFTGAAKCSGHRPTKVEDFGQRVEFNDNDEVRVVRSGDSSASYADGHPRQWQDYEPGKWWKCRDDALYFLSITTPAEQPATEVR